MRKLRLMALSLVFALLVGNLTVFGASTTYDDPYDQNNPTLEYLYTCRDGSNFNELSFKLTGLSEADIVFDGFAYDSSKTYTEGKKYYDGYAVAGSTLYKFHRLSFSSPGSISTPDGSEPDRTGKSYSYEVELVPTDEVPEKSMISTYPHKTAKDIIEVKYLVNGKEVSKADYDKAKTGSYTEKKKKSFTGYGKETVTSEKLTFLGLIKLAQSGPNAESAPWSATFNYRKDQEVEVEMNYLQTYEIVKSESPSTPSTKPTTPAANEPKTPAQDTGNTSTTKTPATNKTTATTPAKKSASKKTVSKQTSYPNAVYINVSTVSATAVNRALKASGVKVGKVKTIILGPKVKKINKGAFKKFKKAKTLVVKTKSLKAAKVKGSLKGSAITKVKVDPSTQKKAVLKVCKKIFKKSNSGKSVKVS